MKFFGLLFDLFFTDFKHVGSNPFTEQDASFLELNGRAQAL